MSGGGKHLFNLESVKELYKSNGAEFLDDFYVNQAYKHNYLPELEIEYNHESGEMEYVTVVS